MKNSWGGVGFEFLEKMAVGTLESHFLLMSFVVGGFWFLTNMTSNLGVFTSHGAGTHSIEGKKWQENAKHIAQDIWGCSAFMLSKWDSYCRVDLGSPSQNFFRAPPARSAGKPMEHSYRHRLRFGGPIWLPKLPSIFPRDFKNFQAFFHRFFVQ